MATDNSNPDAPRIAPGPFEFTNPQAPTNVRAMEVRRAAGQRRARPIAGQPLAPVLRLGCRDEQRTPPQQPRARICLELGDDGEVAWECVDINVFNAPKMARTLIYITDRLLKISCPGLD